VIAHIWLPGDLREIIDALAGADCRSRSSMIVVLIREALAARRAKQ
jgi:metal-responsive CopG/Arc/MetJ family transcriptional regulator